MTAFNPTFQYYMGGIRSSIPAGYIDTATMWDKIANPRPATRQIFEKLRSETDEEERARLKTALPYFTPCAVVHDGMSRSYENISYFTEVATLDFDKLESREYAQSFRDDCFSAYDYIHLAWLSSSGLGVRFLIRIPQAESVEAFKGYYRALKNEFEQYPGFDTAVQNSILPLFLSYDPGAKLRPDPAIMDEWVERLPDPAPPVYVAQNTDNKTMQHIERRIIKLIDPIADNGHPQLRAAAFLLGGYVAGGAFPQNEAISLLDNLIESNAYLRIKANVYKRTARDMIKAGAAKPIHTNELKVRVV